MNYTERTARSKLFRIIDILPAAAARAPFPFFSKLFSHPNRFDLQRPSFTLRGNNNNNFSYFVGTARSINFIPPLLPTRGTSPFANPIVGDSRSRDVLGIYGGTFVPKYSMGFVRRTYLYAATTI